MILKNILYNLPEVKHPVEKKLSFNVKLKWTLIVIGAFFILANIPLFGLEKNSLSQFEYLAIILGTDFGSIISLGIGPIVTASIILQLLVGSGILKIDTHTSEGKKYFQGLQKILVLFFIVFEAMVYVLFGGLRAAPEIGPAILIIQLILGGLAIMFMDELSSKYGFGSGISLFIVAGVAWRLFTGLFQFIVVEGGVSQICFSSTNVNCPGNILIIITSLMNGNIGALQLAFATILATAVIFLVAVWAQNLKVEVPLSYERLRGVSMKWPLAFFYASNIPVILTAALVANIQLFAGILQNALKHPTILGDISNGQAISGFVFWVGSTNVVEAIITGSYRNIYLLQSITHILFYMAISALFAVFWVKTSGMDEATQAKNILSSGLQIPGFRKDPRVLESILSRYIMPLTIMGGLAIGAIAAFADTLGALTSGTALLLAVMIVYQFYQNIAKQHALDMHPALRKIMA